MLQRNRGTRLHSAPREAPDRAALCKGIPHFHQGGLTVGKGNVFGLFPFLFPGFSAKNGFFLPLPLDVWEICLILPVTNSTPN